MVRVVQSEMQLIAKHAMLSMCVACNETSIARTTSVLGLHRQNIEVVV
jgi:hypothetical protein